MSMSKEELETEQPSYLVAKILDLQIQLEHKQRALAELSAAKAQLEQDVEDYKRRAIAEHVRADEAFIDLWSDVTRNRKAVRDGIADYLEHAATVDVGSIFYTPASRELLSICAAWVRNEVDVKWAEARADQRDRELLEAYVPEKTAGWEIICPDGLRRHFPYINQGDAEFDAQLMDKRGCNLYSVRPVPLLERSGLPNCEGTGHHVQSVKDEASDL